MQSWIIVALCSYFFTALSNTLDKLVVVKYVPRPLIYVFYVGILGGVSVVLIPFGVEMPELPTLAAALAAGACFITALYMMYAGLTIGETTRVVPILHAVIPIATFALAYVFLGERLSGNHLEAFLVLVVGLIVISYNEETQKSNYTFLVYALLSGVFFALTYTLAKYVYMSQPFISGFFWMRIGALTTALALPALPGNRQIIREDLQKKNPGKGMLIVGNQLLGATGFVLLDYAISIASVTLVNSLQGMLYVFVFLIVAALSRRIPELHERVTGKILTQKLLAMLIIGYGIYLLGL